MKFFYTIVFIFCWSQSSSQEKDTIIRDLEPVIIRVFEQSRKINEVPAAVNYVGRQTLESFSPTSIVNAVNTTSGVRLEERSPGSYRFNIRGSSLRSPFGVRNVKVYYNDIPITDPSGNTYFNNLGYYNISSLQIIKGPGSSVYGAGTGGVLLIEGLNTAESPSLATEHTFGSYGLYNLHASITTAEETSKNKFGFQHQQSTGYRNHSVSERNIFSWNGRFTTSKHSILKATFLYSHLFYETPGALTKIEYDADPKASRPAAGGFPGAEGAKAAITQKTFLAGVRYTNQFSEDFSNTTVGYGMFTELRNPAIRNYGKNEDPHVGGRTTFAFAKTVGSSRINLNAGAELQQQFSSVTVYKNRNGDPDTLQTLDEIRIRQSLIFLQASFALKGWELTAGGSLNFLRLNFRRSAPTPLPLQERSFSNEVVPRVALSRKFKSLLVYTSIAKGFSPPTSAELLPSGSAINLSLNAESGTNYDIGFRGNIKDLNFDVNAFFFSLTNTIVQRRDAGGGDYFINAGKTAQKGIETSINYPLVKGGSFFRQSIFRLSHTYHYFSYKDFKQLANDFSGKRLPGIAPHTVSTGIDLAAKSGWLANVNYYFSDAIFLNDGNTVAAANYHVVNLKAGYETVFGTKWKLRLLAGVENLLDDQYSLGNDINAFGGRYYNAAAGRNFYVTLFVQAGTN